MVVQQHVLNWLYSVLTSEYHDVNRTYNHVTQALSQYPSLLPRTDVHTYDNGVSALLLHLSGTLPVSFRGTVYRFPISVWVPHGYPREPPLTYITPTENIMVRPGQHVDPQGRVYHPYLAAWPEFWERSTLVDFLALLRDVFAKEPPVVLKQQVTPDPTPPPRPPLPPQLSSPTTPQHHQSPVNDERPPPPPPKSEFGATTTGPPLPALPSGVNRLPSVYSVATSSGSLPPSSRYDSAPPLPTQQQIPAPQGYQQQPPPNHSQSYSSQQQTPAYAQHQGPPPQHQYPSHELHHYSSSVGSPHGPYSNNASGQPQPAAGSARGGPAPPQWQQFESHQQNPAPPASTIQTKPKAPDIMDEPLTLALPSSSDRPAPPPIPPNPEKDALLRQLGVTLFGLRQHARQQNESSLAGLSAQKHAMLVALQNLQNDSAALNPISAMLASNMAALQSSIQEADKVIANSQTQRPPAIDDLLVAPTVVGNQLYEVVAEERALGDAIFVLGRAVERSRISPAVFAKTTRSLAREWYLKKALAKKIGRGMGLVG